MQGRFDPAIAAYQKAISLRPDFAQAYSNMSTPLMYLKRHEEAVAAGKKGLSLRPDSAVSHYNLGAALEAAGNLDEALDHFHRAIQIRPDFIQSRIAIGNVMKAMGRIDEAVRAFTLATEMRPDDLTAMSNLAFTVHFHPDFDAAAILKVQRRWNEKFARPLAGEIRPHQNDPSPHRRLRIGFISPDLRDHPVGRVLLPIFENHDANHFEIYAYSDCPINDPVTARLRVPSAAWCEIVGLSDTNVAAQIRSDRIDILIDLSLQTAGNRLRVFARKPSPVQATYLAYCSTSGMDAMDWRISDPWFDPPGNDESVYSERTLRLTVPYWCYEPIITLDVGPPPFEQQGQITFGCLNTYAKVSTSAWRTWKQLLNLVPNSRLLVHSNPGSHQKEKSSELASEGIDPNRLQFVPGTNAHQYFRQYLDIDIALDPFPYGGGLTTCDALWSGVPVVTLTGRTAVGRGGTSILNYLFLPELIVPDEQNYLRIAAALAADPPACANFGKP